jgi:molybdopterin synthase catalytic subunit
MRICIADRAFSPEAELAGLSRNAAVGALVSFVGYCRAESHGRRVQRLELEHYPGLTEREIERRAAEVCAGRGLLGLVVVHRVGVIPAGEPIVLVAALSAHRAAAFGAVEEMMDYLKTGAPIWKKEISDAGEAWIEPTAQDRDAAARWLQQKGRAQT